MSNGATPESPTPEETSAGVIGSDPTPEASSPEGQTEGSKVDPASLSEYERRAFEGGEKAVHEIKSWQRKFTEADSERQQLRTVGDLAKQLGGGDVKAGAQQVVQLLNQLNQFVGDKQGQKLWQRFQQTGRLSSEEMDMGGFDDEEPDPRDVELQQLKQRLNQTETGQLKTQMRDNFARVFREFGITQEEASEIMGSIESQMDSWAQTDSGREALRGIAQSYKSTRNLVLNQFETDKLFELTERAALRKKQALGQRATDSPPQVATRGSERTERKFNSAHEAGVAAIKEAFSEIGMDPNDPDTLRSLIRGS